MVEARLKCRPCGAVEGRYFYPIVYLHRFTTGEWEAVCQNCLDWIRDELDRAVYRHRVPIEDLRESL